jgi:hypothetical protein
VVLQQELDYLRKKSKAERDSSKVHSKKILSKALVVSSEDVVRLRTEWERKEKEKAEKQLAKSQRTARANSTAKKSIEQVRTKKKAVVIDLEEEDVEQEWKSEQGSDTDLEPSIHSVDSVSVRRSSRLRR